MRHGPDWRAGISWAEGYKVIVESLAHGSRTVSEISTVLGKERSGPMSGYLPDATNASQVRAFGPWQVIAWGEGLSETIQNSEIKLTVREQADGQFFTGQTWHPDDVSIRIRPRSAVNDSRQLAWQPPAVVR